MPYAGSADAQAAIDRLAHVMPGATVTVLTVWEPFMQTMKRSSMGAGPDRRLCDDRRRERPPGGA